MSGLVAAIALVAFLVCPASRPVTPPSTPAPSAIGEDVFGGVAQPDTVPVSLLIQNHGTTDDRLLGASTPVAARVEVHHTQLQHGRRAMLPLADGLIISAGSSIVLEPGAAHVMLIDLKEGLVQGQTFPLTLRFARAGEVMVAVRVRRKVDAAGLPPLPAVARGDLTISLASAPPASPPQSGCIDQDMMS